MKKFKDKNTNIILRKYEKRMDIYNKYENSYDTFPSNREFKDFSALVESKYSHKIWWKLLPKEEKKNIIFWVFNRVDSIYELNEYQIFSLDSQRDSNPLTKEIRDFKIKILTSS